ncbi:MAG: RNA-binding protein [Flavobacteriales bacterium]|nr:MAG: RNA-binding protein [Flavobacteriales bacterium]
MACKMPISDSDEIYIKLESLGSELTGINFNNKLESKPDLNIIEYLYYYNGGGVGILDVNNDGLDDIFFSGNEVGDELYLNQGDMKFKNITQSAGINSENNWSTGVAIADVNNDGLVDIYVSTVSDYKNLEGHNRLYINNGDLTFTETSKETGLDFVGFGTQASFFDYDNDGDLDVYLLNHSIHTPRNYGRANKRFEKDLKSGDRMYENLLNEGNFKFVEVTEKSGIYSSSLGYGLAISTIDVNQDGYTDIYVGNDFHENDYLYLNNGDKTFSEVSKEKISHTSRFTMGVDISDINGDLIQDIFTLDMMPFKSDIFMKSGGEDSDKVSQIKKDYGYNEQLARNHMQLGTNEGIFKEVALITNTYATDWSWSVLIEDFDNDADNDIFISNGIYKRPNDLDFINFQSNILYENYREEENRLERDLIDQMPMLKIPNILFSQKSDYNFEMSGESIGIPPTYSNGSAVSDLDNDGDLDIVSNNINDKAQILENKSENLKKSFIQFNIKNNNGSPSLGTKIIAYTGNKKMIKEITGSRGYASSSSTRVHFGLANYKKVDSIEIKWINGITNKYYDLGVNQIHEFYPNIENVNLNTSNLLTVSEIEEFNYKHIENNYLDYEREPLMPERLSIEGPAYVGSDFNGDGIKDIFIGGAKLQSPELLIQNIDGSFKKIKNIVFEQDSQFEDIDAEAFDFDQDGDMDIYVMSGGNEYVDGDINLMDRLYINNGNGLFNKFPANLPSTNGGSISSADFNKDGYSDLFIGSRSIPGGYGLSPISVIVKSSPETDSYFEVVAQSPLGMVTDSKYTDINNDNILDIVVVGDWMPITILIGEGDNKFSNQTTMYGLANTSGFWNTIEIADLNNDGKKDIIAGNSGLNHKFKASIENPVKIYLDDFDENTSLDPIIFYNFFGEPVPFASRDKLVNSLPYLKKKFLKYNDFVKAKNIELLTEKDEIFETKSIYEMRSMAFMQNEENIFTPSPLPSPLQLSSIEDFYIDGNKIYYVGNYTGNVSELGPSLSNSGGVLTGFDGYNYDSHKSLGLPINYEARHIDKINKNSLLIIGNNNRAYKLNLIEN